jgi:hypothetical protein
MNPLLEGFECYHRRGSRRSVIQPEEMIADTNDNLIGHLAAKLRNTPGGWSPKKERMREHLERLTRMHQYAGAWLDYRDYQITRVGQSFQYDVPAGKRGFLGQFAGHRVRLVCTYNGQFRKWVRVGVVRGINDDDVVVGRLAEREERRSPFAKVHSEADRKRIFGAAKQWVTKDFKPHD